MLLSSVWDIAYLHNCLFFFIMAESANRVQKVNISHGFYDFFKRIFFINCKNMFSIFEGYNDKIKPNCDV